ncbi:hypothetical protein CTKA_01247 [Chthonomonas calidirosea]|uniref:Uncharacterized protein n=1 Tax=Chthonomonas calidirosea (strain DSM 23976 / ICMP 18418 / T49) TaxID=1303518 RepID=S0EXJ5_CHTCT|nr:hypothetical protein [Chthonomonas calidirosea]CCW36626.1 hypothetical protein CCALI_02841 [Chthonomonas calidirosea T49]CEK16768.1 hypothetical protein CTKA_01247 [Chthonomonas calidirosea]
MKVFSPSVETVRLREIADLFKASGHSISISTGIAGAATQEELENPNWEAAFVRWHTPELHDVYLLERSVVEAEAEAREAVEEALRFAYNWPDTAAKLITIDVLRRTQIVYDVQLLPVLFEDQDHPGWETLESLLRLLAAPGDGVIFAEEEGFFDAEGMPLILMEDDETSP